MRIRFARTMILMLVMLGPGIATATSITSNDLTKAQAIYRQRQQELVREGEVEKTNRLARYRTGLEALRQSVKQKGDLDGVRAVDAELNRTALQKTLPAASVMPTTAELAAWITTMRTASESAELERASKTLQLAEQYFQFLDRQAKQAVREDQLDLAAQFKSEIDATKQTPAHQAATFIVAEYRSRVAAPPAEISKAVTLADPLSVPDADKTPVPTAKPARGQNAAPPAPLSCNTIQLRGTGALAIWKTTSFQVRSNDWITVSLVSSRENGALTLRKSSNGLDTTHYRQTTLSIKARNNSGTVSTATHQTRHSVFQADQDGALSYSCLGDADVTATVTVTQDDPRTYR